MPLIIDRVETEMDLVAAPGAAADPAGTAAPPAAFVFPTALTLRDQLELARVLRPVVLEVLRQHLRELSASGALR